MPTWDKKKSREWEKKNAANRRRYKRDLYLKQRRKVSALIPCERKRDTPCDYK
jgi:hypothetical protein